MMSTLHGKGISGPLFFPLSRGRFWGRGPFSLLVFVVHAPFPLVAGLEASFCLGSLLQGDESFP